MTAFTVEQKSQLAKLMATENLTIQHSKIHTAKFDPIKRILYLPIWKDMTSFMYDLLGGHEVGHALYTPADGWHDVATDKTKGKNYKSFLNVIEDARIEKKVIRKYPGLKSSFRKAYAELSDRDFFGIQHRNINHMSFIDRLNIYTKSQYSESVNFSVEEMQMVGEVQMLETWDDVLRVTEKIYGYCKNEQFELSIGDDFEYDIEGNPLDEDGTDSESDNDYDYEMENGNDGEGENSDDESDEPTNEESDGESGSDDDSETESESEEDGNEIVHNKESKESSFDSNDLDPNCITDDNYRRNEVTLLDEKCKPYVYANMPTPILSNIITPAKRVQELMTIDFANQVSEGHITDSKINGYVQEFRNRNERYIALLAKEFEMRKAAKSFSKAKQSDTGDVDVNKLASYRFDDNIFRKIMQVPKGKSHGLILLLDYSGSMSDNMAGSIEQILVLSMFCRKVNIPFHVYAFGNDSSTWSIDNPKTSTAPLSVLGSPMDLRQCFMYQTGELMFNNICLREYLNSKMTNAEFTKALRNMVLLKKSYEGGRYARPIQRPFSERLSNTPLTEALVATQAIMKNFKRSNNLDITNLVIIHDGDADATNCVANAEGGYTYFHPTYENVILQDKKYKHQKLVKANNLSNEMFVSVAEWFTATTDSKIFGFFIVPSQRAKGIIRHYYHNEKRQPLYTKRSDTYVDNELIKQLKRKLDTQKFLQSFNPGYDSYFLISGGHDLMANDGEIEIDGKLTSSKLKNAFMKFNKGKQINRVLVSKFIQGIAA
jgi:hypothetical protein